MTDLLRRPKGERGHVHNITPADAGWGYVGFGLYRLQPGDTAAEATGEREAILVIVEGTAQITGAGQDWGAVGARQDLFSRQAPDAVYLPEGSDWHATATTACTLAVCSAPGGKGYPARRIAPGDVTQVTRGKGANTRHINNIAMEDTDIATSLLVTEVFTPQGHWSSYPSHRHDEDDFPRMTYLEETYYLRLNPAQGFAFQRVYTDDRSLDVSMAPGNHDVTLVPRGHHPCAAPYGYDLYYLNVMAGPRRNWRFEADPDHKWIMDRDV